MSDLVAEAIIDYFNEENNSLSWLPEYSRALPVIHNDDNTSQRQNSGALQLETFINELTYSKISAEESIKSDSTSPIVRNDFEEGQFVVFIRVQDRWGNKGSIKRPQKKIKDNILRKFTGLKLSTSENIFIKFGESFSREVIEEARSLPGNTGWKRTDVVINYVYSSTN